MKAGWLLINSKIIDVHFQGICKYFGVGDSIYRQVLSAALKEAIKQHPGESRKEWVLGMMEKAGKGNSQNTNFQLWQQDNHPIELFDRKILHQKLDYLHYNPVVTGIVEKPEDYLHSSARDYYGLPGLIDIILVEPLIQ